MNDIDIIDYKIRNSLNLSKEEIKLVLTRFEEFTPYQIEKMPDYELRDARESVSLEDTFDWLVSSFGTRDTSKNYNHKFGWICPMGNFYSCGSGYHEYKSQMIVRANKDLMDAFLSLFDETKDAIRSLRNNNGVNNPSDFLLKRNWCRFQQRANLGEPEPVLHPIKELTERQISTIYDMAFKFRLYRDPITKEIYDWDKII